MNREKLKQFLKDWDEGSFDLTERTARPTELLRSETEKTVSGEGILPRLVELRYRIFRIAYPVMSVLLLIMMSAFLLMCAIELPPFGAADNPAHNEVMQRYLEKNSEETGAVNAVSGVILDYRAFDTLGESHVLYTALIAVLVLLLAGRDEEPPAGRPDEKESFAHRDPLIRTAASILVPAVILYGLCTIVNGHLGPGGGFSGGAIIGAGLILYSLAFGFEKLEKLISGKSFKAVVVSALCFYSLAKGYSFFCGANGLQSLISPGEAGRILSGGLILPLNICVGLVVACTMYGIYSLFKRGRL